MDPMMIPIPPPPPEDSTGGSSSASVGATADPARSAAWAAAQAAMSHFNKPAPAPQTPAAAPFPWMMPGYQGATDAFAQWNAAASNGAGGSNWNPGAVPSPVYRSTAPLSQQPWRPPPTPTNPPWQNGNAQNKFTPFAVGGRGRGTVPHLGNNFVGYGGGRGGYAAPGRGGFGRGGGYGGGGWNNAPVGTESSEMPDLGMVPDGVRKFVQRAFLASKPEDHDKLKAYIKARVKPLLDSGTAKVVNWDVEPLPHTRNYVVPTGWISAAKATIPGANANGASAPVLSSYSASSSASSTPASSAPSGRGGFTWATPTRPSRPSEEPRRRRDGSRSRSPDAKRSPPSHPGWFIDREGRGGGGGGSSSSTSDDDTPKLSKKQLKRKQWIEKQESKKLKKEEKEKKKEKKKPMRFDYVDPQEAYKKADRQRRFAQDVIVAAPVVPYRISRSKLVIGTCQDVDKKFFRLTAAPDPATVRPLHILRKSLEVVKRRYKEGVDYRQLTDNFKSIRQDLTVQRIRNDFTVSVYEINARICLENKDREEFNQCQSQLKLLYQEVEGCQFESEFTAYRLLYYIAMDNSQDITTLLRSLRPEMRKDSCLAYALKVRAKLSMGNQVGFFALYPEAPKMCAYILDFFVARERGALMNTVIKAFKPSLPLKLLADWLCMDEDEIVDWLAEKKIYVKVGDVLDCRAHAAVTF